ncbi:DUF475 domain-containing protein [Candidatus Woesearchaeota archaeon]|nr:DUF475 domain-containing protein [Candidatus Woesearchaeota archaeon]
MPEIFSLILIVLGLTLFETISSIDNAVINAEVLRTMSAKARKWFLWWGILFAVFIVRGLLPWMIIWGTTPSLGFWGSLTATFSADPMVAQAIEQSAPILLMGGGVFLLFLFFHWLFMEPKIYGLHAEKFFHRQGVWFYAVVSVILAVLVWYALKRDQFIAFGAVIGSTAFFITHGFKQNAEKAEHEMLHGKGSLSDVSKILYLEVIDTTFSIDGVLGAFAFTLSIPLILLGNGLGAIMVRQITVGNIERVKKYKYLKNGAMYSVLAMGTVMVVDAFGVHVPNYLMPVITFAVLGFFFYKSWKDLPENSSSA